MSHRARNVVALCAAALVSVALIPAASADRDRPVVPSREQVDRAQRQVEETERSVAEIQAELAAASDELARLGVEAQKAAEAYNGALYEWQQARTEARQARARAERASTRAQRSRDQLAGYALAQDTTAPALTTLSSTLQSTNSHALLAEIADADTTSRAMAAKHATWSASAELADVYEQDAADALDAADAAKERAADARAAAQAAVDAQEAAVASMAERRTALLAELARVQNISVALATRRQTGLEERRQRRLAEQRERELEQQEQQEQAPESSEPESNDPKPDDPKPDNPKPDNPKPDPTPPTNPNPPSPSGGAQAAIAFARAQLGEPYVWGAAGPSSWDCSGLTMGAWASAGVYLPHYSVAQYAATTPISYSQLRPGDLIFWASNSSDPGSIFHVGLYIGGGQMIHAPRTGQDVQIQDVWYWESPDFFGRP